MTTIDPSISYKIDDVEHVPEEYFAIDCPFTKYLKTEAQTREEREISREREAHRLERLKDVVEELFQCQQVLKVYKSYESVVQGAGIKLSIMPTTCPTELLSLYKDVVVEKEQWMKICIESENQSDCLQWFSERYKRITSSRKAHQIKTRKERFENLADQFKKNKFQGRMTEAMAYGIQTESIARNAFSNLTGQTVDTVGLVIKIEQPFLAASPDGIIIREWHYYSRWPYSKLNVHSHVKTFTFTCKSCGENFEHSVPSI